MLSGRSWMWKCTEREIWAAAAQRQDEKRYSSIPARLRTSDTGGSLVRAALWVVRDGRRLNAHWQRAAESGKAVGSGGAFTCTPWLPTLHTQGFPLALSPL